MDRSAILALLQLPRDVPLPDRPAQVLHGVRAAWAEIGRDGEDGALADALVELLRDPDDLALARLALPALRHGVDAPENLQGLQRSVVERTSDLRTLIDSHVHRTQRDFDDVHYLAEKETLQEAELYRLGLILYSCEALMDDDARHVRRWLAACPLAACHGQRSGPAPRAGDHRGGARHASREVDTHMLRVLLFSSSVLTLDERDAVRAWLALCPLQAREPDGHAAP